MQTRGERSVGVRKTERVIKESVNFRGHVL